MGRRRRGDPCISRSLRGQPIDQLDGDGVHVGRGLGAYAGGGLLRGGLVGGLGNGGLHLGEGVIAVLLRLGEEAGALLLGLALGLDDDGVGLAPGLGELRLAGLALLAGLLARALRALQVALDLLLALVEGLEDPGPGELGEDDPR